MRACDKYSRGPGRGLGAGFGEGLRVGVSARSGIDPLDASTSADPNPNPNAQPVADSSCLASGALSRFLEEAALLADGPDNEDSNKVEF